MENIGSIDNTYTILSIKAIEYRARTYSVRHNKTQALYLIEAFKDGIPANLINIMNYLITLNHPNIIRILGIGNGPIVLNNYPPQGTRAYIVYENVSHTTLFDYINIQRFTEKQAKWIFKKILEGVRALHNANICHRDLTIESVLLDDNYNPKIYDLHYCCINMYNLVDNLGKINYIAPEVSSEEPYNGIMADIFSLGQILFNLVTGINGFNSARDTDNFYRLIIAQHFDYYWQQIDNFFSFNLSQNFKNLFLRMVSPNPAQRPTIDQILNAPWMQEINNLDNEKRNALENEVRNEFQIREKQIKPNQ